MAEDQIDPDFLALSQRQRDRIDRVFDRALRRTGGGRKRRKLNPRSDLEDAEEQDAGGFLPDDDAGGGFVADDGDDGGGFLPEDDDGGGFVPDDEDGGGGFLPDDDAPPASSPSTPAKRAPSTETKIPFARIPSLLAALNLPADDDVLDVFRASATGWADEDEGPNARRRRAGADEDEGDRDSKLAVDRKDFRAVCAALMGGDDGGDEGEPDNGEDVDMEERNAGQEDDAVLGPGRRRQRPAATRRSPSPSSGSDDNEDGFEPTMSENSSLSSLSSDSEYGASRRKSKATASGSATKSTSKGKGKGRATATATDTDASAAATPRRKGKGKGKKDALVADDGPIKLNSRQKEMVKVLWDMLKPPQPDQQAVGGGFRSRKGQNNPNVLGREELKGWVRQMGEMWTSEEITDMISLFSTQHEKRGLSYEDFGQIAAREKTQSELRGLAASGDPCQAILISGDSQQNNPQFREQVLMRLQPPCSRKDTETMAEGQATSGGDVETPFLILDGSKYGWCSDWLYAMSKKILSDVPDNVELTGFLISCSLQTDVTQHLPLNQSLQNMADHIETVHRFARTRGDKVPVWPASKCASNIQTAQYAYAGKLLVDSLHRHHSGQDDGKGAVVSVKYLNAWDETAMAIERQTAVDKERDDKDKIYKRDGIHIENYASVIKGCAGTSFVIDSKEEASARRLTRPTIIPLNSFLPEFRAVRNRMDEMRESMDYSWLTSGYANDSIHSTRKFWQTYIKHAAKNARQRGLPSHNDGPMLLADWEKAYPDLVEQARHYVAATTLGTVEIYVRFSGSEGSGPSESAAVSQSRPG